jgi:hypothetical protein
LLSVVLFISPRFPFFFFFFWSQMKTVINFFFHFKMFLISFLFFFLIVFNLFNKLRVHVVCNSNVHFLMAFLVCQTVLLLGHQFIGDSNVGSLTLGNVQSSCVTIRLTEPNFFNFMGIKKKTFGKTF